MREEKKEAIKRANLFVCFLFVQAVDEHINITTLVSHVVVVLATSSVIFIVSSITQLVFFPPTTPPQHPTFVKILLRRRHQSSHYTTTRNKHIYSLSFLCIEKWEGKWEKWVAYRLDIVPVETLQERFRKQVKISVKVLLCGDYG